MKIIVYGYRDWAVEIFKNIDSKDKYLVTNLDYDIIDKIKPSLVFFIGWSSIIPENIINNHTCICLHPSPLPKYRGGSPIQNQLLNGETDSAVTLFVMDKGIDTGDILFQSPISLDGSLNDIFNRIVKRGIEGINHIIGNDMQRIEQDESQSSFFNRKTPSDSEIKISDFLLHDSKYFHNKIRGLNDPYPNAYIICKNGKKLYLLATKYED
jgi:methionyl-tRNA formyltransferase|tara:strand:- start:2147 stop:2779 length:633 start_codon:yes stop_codon:yes gene_type:complete